MKGLTLKTQGVGKVVMRARGDQRQEWCSGMFSQAGGMVV